MGRIWKYCFLLILVFCLLCGCKAKPKAHPVTLVTGVNVTCQQSGELLRRQYTQPEKVNAVLYYLAGLRPYGVADNDPERVTGVVYRIEVLLSDGQSHIYRQRADRYISKDCRAWRLILPERAAKLHGILQELPSDIP